MAFLNKVCLSALASPAVMCALFISESAFGFDLRLDASLKGGMESLNIKDLGAGITDLQLSGGAYDLGVSAETYKFGPATLVTTLGVFGFSLNVLLEQEQNGTLESGKMDASIFGIRFQTGAAFKTPVPWLRALTLFDFDYGLAGGAKLDIGVLNLVGKVSRLSRFGLAFGAQAEVWSRLSAVAMGEVFMGRLRFVSEGEDEASKIDQETPFMSYALRLGVAWTFLDHKGSTTPVRPPMQNKVIPQRRTPNKGAPTSPPAQGTPAVPSTKPSAP